MDELPQVVRLEVQPPIGYERSQLLVRLLVSFVFLSIHQSLGGLFGALYLLLPVVAAILISQRTGPGFVAKDGPWIVKTLEWVVGLYAYMLFVTDRFPLGPAERPLRLITPLQGSPSVGDALSRLITSLPHALLLLVFSILSALASLLMALSVLLSKSVPETLHSFQLRMLSWLSRVFVYHASLCSAYPRFSMSSALLPPVPPAPPASEAHGSHP